MLPGAYLTAVHNHLQTSRQTKSRERVVLQTSAATAAAAAVMASAAVYAVN